MLKSLLELLGIRKKEIKPCPFPHSEPIAVDIKEGPFPIHHGEPIPVDPPIPAPEPMEVKPTKVKKTTSKSKSKK